MKKTWKGGDPLVTKESFLNAYRDWRTERYEEVAHDARALNKWRIEGEEVVVIDFGLQKNDLHQYGVMLRSDAEYLISTGGKIRII